MSPKEIKVIEAMETYGGSFVKALAECFRRADRRNFVKLLIAFEGYWTEYEIMSRGKTHKDLT
jgi:pyruvate/2-oxoacid:ferredoxin oxidoreductase beta subunit